jgi:hypothetical protein
VFRMLPSLIRRTGSMHRRKKAPEVLALHAAIRRADVTGAMAALSRCTPTEAKPTAALYHGLLALVVCEPERWAAVKQHMAECGVPADERTLTLEVRGLVQEGRLREAMQLLDAQTYATPKLRTYAPLLRALCERRDLPRASELEAQMAAAGIELGEEQAVDLCALAAVCKQGEVGGGGSGRGGTLLASRLRQLQASHSTLTPTSLRSLHAAFDAPSQSVHARFAAVSADGRCSCCGTRLGTSPLSAEEQRTMGKALASAAANVSDRHAADLDAFAEWVASLPSPPDDARRYIIDGPNVAYRNQNFAGGAFSFEQVELARQALLEASSRREDVDAETAPTDAETAPTAASDAVAAVEPLIVMPQRYLSNDTVPNHTHKGSAGFSEREPRQAVTQVDKALIQSWREGGHLWVTPDGVSDDLYWMLATVVARGGGARVVTNDAMRDHIFAMGFDSRVFERWRSRHVVRFEFSHGMVAGRAPPSLTLNEPPPYSVEIHAGGGVATGGHGSDGRSRWHFPATPPPCGPAEVSCSPAEWLCVDGLPSRDD